MKTTTIPAGYRVTVTSWENDADNYNTKTMQGLTEGQIKFIVAVCKLLESDNPHEFGNMFEPSDREIEKLMDALQDVIDAHDERPEYCDSPEAVMENVVYKLGLSGGEFFTRVCEKYKVEYIPEAITMEDVTDRFE